MPLNFMSDLGQVLDENLDLWRDYFVKQIAESWTDSLCPVVTTCHLPPEQESSCAGACTRECKGCVWPSLSDPATKSS